MIKTIVSDSSPAQKQAKITRADGPSIKEPEREWKKCVKAINELVKKGLLEIAGIAPDGQAILKLPDNFTDTYDHKTGMRTITLQDGRQYYWKERRRAAA